jgi:hypothetical protein
MQPRRPLPPFRHKNSFAPIPRAWRMALWSAWSRQNPLKESLVLRAPGSHPSLDVRVWHSLAAARPSDLAAMQATLKLLHDMVSGAQSNRAATTRVRVGRGPGYPSGTPLQPRYARRPQQRFERAGGRNCAVCYIGSGEILCLSRYLSLVGSGVPVACIGSS